MHKPAEAHHPIHDLLKARWSPRAFDSRPVESEKLLSLFEAARWSPSGGNEQPWAFIVGTLDDKPTHDKFLRIMTGQNPIWAKNVPVLILSVARMMRSSGAPNSHAFYDVGQAVAHLSVQATDLGLRVHQMGGFDTKKAHEVFNLPEGYQPVTIIAVGYAGNPDDLPEPMRERERTPRTRKPIHDFVFEGTWEQPLALEAEVNALG